MEFDHKKYYAKSFIASPVLAV